MVLTTTDYVTFKCIATVNIIYEILQEQTVLNSRRNDEQPCLNNAKNGRKSFGDNNVFFFFWERYTEKSRTRLYFAKNNRVRLFNGETKFDVGQSMIGTKIYFVVMRNLHLSTYYESKLFGLNTSVLFLYLKKGLSFSMVFIINFLRLNKDTVL